MELINYIKSYDYSNYFLIFKEEFLKQETVKKYLVTNPEENFIKFAEDFWIKPHIYIPQLRNKYNMNKLIVQYSDILRAYPTEKYLSFLKVFYSMEYSILDLANKLRIPYDRIIKIVAPIYLDNFDKYCPECDHKIVKCYITGYNHSKKKMGFKFECNVCENNFAYSSLFTKKQVIEQLVRFNKVPLDEFDCKTSNLKCPKCDGYLELDMNPKSKKLIIKCANCHYFNDDIENIIKQFKESKKGESKITAIKVKQEELTGSKLKIDNSYLEGQEIKIQNCNEVIKLNLKSLFFDKQDHLDNVITEIKKCNIVEKIILMAIIRQDIKSNGNVIISLNDIE